VRATTGWRWIQLLHVPAALLQLVDRPPLAEARDAQPVDPPAGERQQRRQQGEGRGHRHRDRDRRRDRHPVEEGDAEQQHPQQRDDHGQAGEEDGAPGGVDRPHRRRLGVEPFVEPVAEAGEDEERVVDADPEPDHRRQLGGEVGGVEDVRPERDEAEADPQREERGEDRQPHRDRGAEGEEQDDHRGAQPDQERGVAFGLAHLLDRLAAEVDLRVGPGHGFGWRHRCFDRLLVQFVALLVELDRRVGDLAVGGDRRVAPARVGAGDAGHVRHRLDLGEGGRHAPPHRRRLDPHGGAEDDRRRFARLRREALFEQLHRPLRVRGRQLEVFREGRAGRAGGEADDEEGRDPADYHRLAVRRGPVGEATHGRATVANRSARPGG
jgi:hypothetical protein